METIKETMFPAETISGKRVPETNHVRRKPLRNLFIKFFSDIYPLFEL
jgi:hypothetical protein